jgi:hypothetical protein
MSVDGKLTRARSATVESNGSSKSTDTPRTTSSDPSNSFSRLEQISQVLSPAAKKAREDAKEVRMGKENASKAKEEATTGVLNPYYKIEKGVTSGGKSRRRKNKGKKTKKARRRN